MRIKQEQLKRLRVQAGWTQEEIAAKCRIDVRTYRKYERGEVNRGLTGLSDFNRSDQYDVLARIAAALELAGPEDLIEKRGAAEDTPPGPGSPYHPSWYVHREPEERKALNRLRSAGAPAHGRSGSCAPGSISKPASGASAYSAGSPAAGS